MARFVAAARGLGAAHAAGMVHRDFKPDNVLLGDDGEVQVADFGIARLDGSDVHGIGAAATADGLDLTRTGTLLGTPLYMAPEQLRGEAVDARADVFACCRRAIAWASRRNRARPSVPPWRGRISLIASARPSVASRAR